jgi:transposase InsO family protein
MARSVGSTIESSLALKEYIADLRAAGWSLSRIATEVGRDKSYVSRVLKQDLSKQRRQRSAVEAVIAAKRTDQFAAAGVETIVSHLVRTGQIDQADVPYDQALFARVRQQGLSYKAVGGRGDNRSYHVYFRDGLTEPCQRVQVDGAGPFAIAGEPFYLFVSQDRFSRLLYAEFVPHSYGSSLVPFARRLVDTFGIPQEIQLDNAVTWRVQRSHPGRLAWALLSLGVERIHFIPEAQPTRNGGIERQVSVLKNEFLRQHDSEYGLTFASIEDARVALTQFLDYYNNVRQHTALPKVPGQNRLHMTPAEVHVKRADKAAIADQCVSFSRFMSQGYAVLHSSVVAAFPGMAERYATWECRLDGTGRVLHRSSVVGTFHHNFTSKYPDIGPCLVASPAAGLAAGDVSGRVFRFDPLAYAQRLLADNRHKRPRVSRLPAGWELETDSDGTWRLFDSNGDLVVDWLNADADHILEFVPAWDLLAA